MQPNGCPLSVDGSSVCWQQWPLQCLQCLDTFGLLQSSWHLNSIRTLGRQASTTRTGPWSFPVELHRFEPREAQCFECIVAAQRIETHWPKRQAEKFVKTQELNWSQSEAKVRHFISFFGLWFLVFKLWINPKAAALLSNWRRQPTLGQKRFWALQTAELKFQPPPSRWLNTPKQLKQICWTINVCSTCVQSLQIDF